MATVRYTVMAAIAIMAAATTSSAQSGSTVPAPSSSGVNSVTSPIYALAGLKGRIDWPLDFQWTYVPNYKDGGSDLINIYMKWQAGRYAAIGFSPLNMQGFITACNVPAADPSQAVCTDVIGHNGGGVDRNPVQYSKLLWARAVDGGNTVEAQIEVPVSAVNISIDSEGMTRLIFAASAWDSNNSMPLPHGANGKCILHVDPFKGTVSSKDYPIATQASHVFQAFSNYAVWWYVVYNGTDSSSYMSINFQLTGSNWAGIGFASQGMNGKILICRYGDSAGASCGDYDGMDYGIKLAAQQVSKIEYHFTTNGVHNIGVVVPLSYSDYTINAALSNQVNRTIFATSTWDSAKGMPNPHNASGHTIRYINFFTNSVFSSQPYSTVYASLPNAYYTVWGLLATGKGFGELKLRMNLVHKIGYYAGFGFANTSMGGPLVACYTPADNSLGAQCRDFIGLAAGGVNVNPAQTSQLLASFSQQESGLTSSIVDIDLAAFNVSVQSAGNDYQRIIQAYGMWDDSQAKPTYHGPNATYWQANLVTGKINGTGPATQQPTESTDDFMDAVNLRGAFAGLRKYMMPDVKNMLQIPRVI